MKVRIEIETETDKSTERLSQLAHAFAQSVGTPVEEIIIAGADNGTVLYAAHGLEPHTFKEWKR